MSPYMKNITLLYTRDKDLDNLINRTIVQYAGLILKIFLNPVLAVGGVSSNLINIAVFLKIGLKEGTTQSFVLLSVTDGLAAISSMTNCICYILVYSIYPGPDGGSRNLHAAYFITIISLPYFLNFSTLITTVIAVVRCCCVVMPLRVKQVMTAGRQLTAILIFACIFCCVQIYATSSGRFVLIFDQRTNSSRLLFIGVNAVLLDAFRNTFCYFTYLVVLMCVVILILALRRAANFQSSASHPGAHQPSDDSKRKNNSRETQVMKTVVFIAVVFIISNIPTALVALLRLNVAGFSRTGRYRDYYEGYLILTETCSLININANIFIYFFFNRHYKMSFLTLLKLNFNQKSGKF